MPRLAFDFKLTLTDPEQAHDIEARKWLEMVEKLIKRELQNMPFNPVIHDHSAAPRSQIILPN